jgi:hypothetical protein
MDNGIAPVAAAPNRYHNQHLDTCTEYYAFPDTDKARHHHP